MAGLLCVDGRCGRFDGSYGGGVGEGMSFAFLCPTHFDTGIERVVMRCLFSRQGGISVSSQQSG